MKKRSLVVLAAVGLCLQITEMPAHAQAQEAQCWDSEPLRFPAGAKDDVIQRIAEFLTKVEGVPVHPYWPGGKSGITIGVGWDIGQHSKERFAVTWAKLPQSDIELLQRASELKGAKAKALLPQLGKVTIPRDVALDVLAQDIRDLYPATATVFPGFEALPAEAKVVLLSVVFNRGKAMGSDPNWLTAMQVDTRWEMRRFRDDVQRMDMFAIYAHLGTMKRLWESAETPGVNVRRRDEQAMLRPLVDKELRWENEREAKKAKGLPPCRVR